MSILSPVLRPPLEKPSAHGGGGVVVATKTRGYRKKGAAPPRRAPANAGRNAGLPRWTRRQATTIEIVYTPDKPLCTYGIYIL